MNILFTICGRAGSKGIKNKNIKNFCGMPLPYYSLAVIDMLKGTDARFEYDVVVNSDSKELIDMIQTNPFGSALVIRREEVLGGDTVPKIAVINDCLTRAESMTGKVYDVVIDLDITSPLRTVSDLYQVILKHTETGADVTTTVAPSRRNPYFNMLKKTEHGYKKVLESNYTARQQAPEMFDMNASIYAYNPAYLATGKGVLDGYCECIAMYDTGILDLDHEGDFELMEVIAAHLFQNHEEFKALYLHLKEHFEK